MTKWIFSRSDFYASRQQNNSLFGFEETLFQGNWGPALRSTSAIAFHSRTQRLIEAKEETRGTSKRPSTLTVRWVTFQTSSRNVWCKGTDLTEEKCTAGHIWSLRKEKSSKNEDSRFLSTTICNIVKLFAKKTVNFVTDKKVLKQQFSPPWVDMEISRKKLYY